MERLYGEKDDPPSDERDYLIREDIPDELIYMLKRNEVKFAAKTELLDMQEKGCIADGVASNVYDELELSIVYLRVVKNGAPAGEGSGTIITKDGHILTCSHVIADADKVFARVYCPGMPGGDYKDYECTILAPRFKDCDMAVIKLPEGEYKPLSIRPAKVPVGYDERTLIMGYPLGKMLTGDSMENLCCSKFFGRIASKQTVHNIDRFYVDSMGLHGNSGSPVISMEDGRMIGIFTGAVALPTENNFEEINYFFPITYFWERFMQAD